MLASLRAVLALGGVAALAAGCQGTVSRDAPIHPVQNMDFQAKFEAQEANAFFPDGRGMRPRVAGTIPRGGLKDDLHRDQGQSADGTWATTLPPGMELSAELLARGRDRFDIYCAPCHDATGSGKGIVVERGMTPPPTFHQDRLRKFSVGQFYDIATHGVRSMRGYAAQVPTEDRWAIAAYARALQLSQYARLEELPPDVAAKNGWKAPEKAPVVLPPEPPAKAPAAAKTASTAAPQGK